MSGVRISHQFENWFEMTENGRYSLQGRCTDRPPWVSLRAGRVVKQAPVLSAAGGAVKQSEAILEWRFLSSPILSLQEKERMGKRKNASFAPVLFLPRRTRTLRWAQYLSCAWQERYWIERTAFRVSEGFFCPISAHGRSLRSL